MPTARYRITGRHALHTVPVIKNAAQLRPIPESRQMHAVIGEAVAGINLYPLREQYEALQQRRGYKTISAYEREYAKRRGIKGTISQGVWRADAAAINSVRIANWFVDIPRAQAR